jgi:hypothetical protein
MSALLQLGFHLVQLSPHPLPHGPPHNEKLPRPGLRADMREAQEVEALRLPQSRFVSIGRREASKLQDTGFLGV